LWNAGIFIWSVKSILKAFEEFQPEMFALFMEGYESYNSDKESGFIQENYSKSENISIDYAIMENAKNVYVLPATFDWNDLGTWGSLHEKLPKDDNNNAVVNATVLLQNASNNIIRTALGKQVIVDGLDDYIIVDKDSVLLIYPKSKEQEIKGIVSQLKS
jgi:mannose-1-phosphate guanylyltransferase